MTTTVAVPLTIHIPEKFSFSRGFFDFDHVLAAFDWTPRNRAVVIDLTTCQSANFQAMALLIQYAWFLTANGCRVTFKYPPYASAPTQILRKIGAADWFEILMNDGRNFGVQPDKTFALRRRADVENTINRARRAIRNYNIGFPQYLSYIISELLYNATEHGCRQVSIDRSEVWIPSVFQFGRYPASDRLVFLFSDVGVGIKRHLEQAYPPFPTDQDAIKYALKPNVSGTFVPETEPYRVRNNAGMGLTISSLMLKRLRGDMYIVSHNGLVHVSPEDVTTRNLRNYWAGTFVLIILNVSAAPQVSVEELVAEISRNAEDEVREASEKEQSSKIQILVNNYFGKYAEDKDAAIGFRDRRLLPAIAEGKKIELDFREVETAPHSFLNALLATPIQRLGVKAYQWIRVYNASGPVHEVIQAIFESNLPEIK